MRVICDSASDDVFGSNVIFDPLHNNCCDFDVERNTELSKFSSVSEFMRRLPIQKALTDQHLALVREVLDFPDEADTPTRFPERMVKGCMLRMGYAGALKNAYYLKSKFQKPYKFIIHSVLQALSHCKGGYEAIRDYQMNMITALVLNKKYNFSPIIFHYMAENITTKSRTWVYPRFVQMLIDHAYPDIETNVKDDLLVLSHMSNDSLKQFARYHPNHPEPTKVAEFFGFIKDETMLILIQLITKTGGMKKR
ncbi:hypothetical protein Hanom_Chr05g00417481 [Helianthus anomalus]